MCRWPQESGDDADGGPHAIQQRLVASVENGGLAVWNLLDAERLVILRTPDLVAP
jgi:hypothetical protein